MGKSIALLVGLVVVLVAYPRVGYAAGTSEGNAKWTLSLTSDYTASPWTSEVGWSNRAVKKLGFGAKNLLLGWTEFFTEPMKAHQDGSNVLTGIGTGLKNGLEDTLGGVVHIVTFPITEVDAPLPGGGVKIM